MHSNKIATIYHGQQAPVWSDLRLHFQSHLPTLSTAKHCTPATLASFQFLKCANFTFAIRIFTCATPATWTQIIPVRGLLRSHAHSTKPFFSFIAFTIICVIQTCVYLLIVRLPYSTACSKKADMGRDHVGLVQYCSINKWKKQSLSSEGL